MPIQILEFGLGMTALPPGTVDGGVINATLLSVPRNEAWAPLATLEVPGMVGTPTWEIVTGGTLFALGS